MGSSRERNFARLADSAADFIAAYPEAAAWFFRRVAQVLDRGAETADEERRERDADSRRRGFGP